MFDKPDKLAGDKITYGYNIEATRRSELFQHFAFSLSVFLMTRQLLGHGYARLVSADLGGLEKLVVSIMRTTY